MSFNTHLPKVLLPGGASSAVEAARGSPARVMLQVMLPGMFPRFYSDCKAL